MGQLYNFKTNHNYKMYSFKMNRIIKLVSYLWERKWQIFVTKWVIYKQMEVHRTSAYQWNLNLYFGTRHLRLKEIVDNTKQTYTSSILNKKTRINKSTFSYNNQQITLDCDFWGTVNKKRKPYDCPRSMLRRQFPRDSMEWRSQIDLGCLAELRRQKLWFGEAKTTCGEE